MIIPFIYNLYDYTKDRPMFLWVFYKFINFCKEYNLPIIAQEDMFKDIEYYKKKNHNAANNNWHAHYILPSNEDIRSVLSYKIPKSFDKKIVKKYKNNFECWSNLLKHRNILLENKINEAIDQLEKETNKKTKCLLCWISFKSLEYVCKKRNIKLVNYEFSSIRRGVYNCSLGYFCYNTKYNTKQIINNYKNFKSNNIFQRNELLAILLSKEYLHYINYLNSQPIYDIGIAGGLDFDVFENSLDHKDMTYITNNILHLLPPDSISLRRHPYNSKNNYSSKFIIDDSINSIEWISKCKRIVNNMSNVGFESMLYGRTSYVLSKDMPFYFKSVNNLNKLEETVVSLDYLNYIIFGFFAPFDLMFNKEYIEWRLTQPSILEIYNYNLNYILKEHNLNMKIFNLNASERFYEILKKTHNISKFDTLTYNKIYNNETEKIANLEEDVKNKCFTIDEFERKIKNLEEDINKCNIKTQNLENIVKEDILLIDKLNKDLDTHKNILERIINERDLYKNNLDNIINSKSWKITKPLRIITNKIKKNEKN